MRVTCATCANENEKKCAVKKNISISLNKRRNCPKYVLETSKVKEKQIIKSVKLGYEEREAMRAEYKRQLKIAKQQAAQGQPTADPAHPMTGDLSRFTSNAE